MVGAAVTALAAVNLPAAWNGGFVDPVLSRDQDPPAAWMAAAAELDALPAGFRVMQLPGAEFGAFRWGYTVDPPLPGLTERPFVSRDLLPLGSPPAMDLLYALDDRFQTGIAEPAVDRSDRPAVRRRHDLGAERHLVRPLPQPTSRAHRGAVRPADAAAGLAEPVTYGEPFVPTSVRCP